MLLNARLKGHMVNPDLEGQRYWVGSVKLVLVNREGGSIGLVKQVVN